MLAIASVDRRLICLRRQELALYLSHGHIIFDLLGYMHKPGVKLLLRDDLTGDKVAIITQ